MRNGTGSAFAKSGVIHRRLFLAAAAAAVASPALAEDLTYKGFIFDASGVGGRLPDETIRSLKAQVDIVAGVAIKPEILAFFRSVPMRLSATTPGGPGAYSFELHRMILSTAPDPPQNPVLLHEFIHSYQDQRLADGRTSPELRAFYAKAKASGDWPAQSYMLKNPAEFYAMCASVVLWGKAARPPLTRDAVRQKAPDLYAWIVATFYPPGTGP